MTNDTQSLESLRQQVAELQQEVAKYKADSERLQRSEDELRRSQSLLQATIENLPLDFFAIGPDGRYIMDNAVCRANWGRLVGKTPAEACPDKDVLSLWLENNRRAFAGERVEGDVEFTVHNEKRFCHNVIAPIREDDHIWGILGVNVDITEQKRAEAGLRNSERTMRTLIDASPESILLLDPERNALIINETAARRLGKTVDEIIGQKIHTFVPPEVAARRDTYVAEVVRTGKPIRFQDQRSGRYFESSMHPVLDEQGKVVAVAILGIDQTERLQAQEALKQAHDQLEQRVEERTAELVRVNRELVIFRRFVEASRQGFAMVKLDGEITYANPAIARLFGAKGPEDVARTHVSAYCPEEYMRRREKEVLPALLRDGHWEGEIAISHPGESIIVLQNSFLVRDEQGNPAYLATVLTDITERKQAEEALRQSEEKYRGLLEACPDAVVMTDLKGKILFASRQTWKLSGLSDSQELVGQSVFDYVIEDDRRRLAENISRLLETAVRRNTEYTALRQDGTLVPTEISSTVNRDANGQAIAVMAVIRDVRERKRAEEILRKEHRTLKHLLQSSDHERQLIAYEIHDGLAQQLAGAIMQFQTFHHLKETKPKEAVKAFEAGMTMLQQGHFEARRLISGVRPPILDEEGVVAAVAHLVNEQNRLKGPKIEYRSRVAFDRLVPILENAIYRIAQEGLANACQHSKSDDVRVSLLQREDHVRIEVRDWGDGFNPKEVKEGCYGLVGMRQRARLLDGKCSIRSTAGRGTRITVELPLVMTESDG